VVYQHGFSTVFGIHARETVVLASLGSPRGLVLPRAYRLRSVRPQSGLQL
jgi:hypothetical protein